jgi:hypothetical protein
MHQTGAICDGGYCFGWFIEQRQERSCLRATRHKRLNCDRTCRLNTVELNFHLPDPEGRFDGLPMSVFYRQASRTAERFRL